MEKEACPHCLSLYEVTTRTAPMPDEDHFDCEVCGKLVRSWKSNRYPEFRLLKAGKKPSDV
jgi:hypothetical protein